MRVRCVNAKGRRDQLTEGSFYEVLADRSKKSTDAFKIRNDSGERRWYKKSRFAEYNVFCECENCRP